MANEPAIGHDWYHHPMGSPDKPYFGKLWVCRRCGAKINYGDDITIPNQFPVREGERSCEEEQVWRVHNQ